MTERLGCSTASHKKRERNLCQPAVSLGFREKKNFEYTLNQYIFSLIPPFKFNIYMFLINMYAQ